jgi:hypothetical protein
MTETKPKHRWFQFSIRELLLITAVVALAVGWWLTHTENEELRSNYRVLKAFSDATNKVNAEKINRLEGALNEFAELKADLRRQQTDKKKMHVSDL